MERFVKFSVVFILLVSIANGLQNRYKIIPENCTIIYIDHQYLDATFEITEINTIQGTFTRKTDLPESYRLLTKGFKWVVDDYHLPVLQFDKRLKDVLEMELFDFQSVFVQQARPPIVWPIEKGVTYRIESWVPDSSKYPPNLPEGKWKFEITEAFANKTKAMVSHWFVNIKYAK